MSGRNRRFFDDDDDDEEEISGSDARGWSRTRRTNGPITRERRNGVSKDPLSDVRAIVEDDWKETLDENFHPITLALDMLDTSSLGRARELEHFKKTNLQIEQALQSTVNEHFQGFNASVGTYGLVTGSINESRRQVKSSRDALLRAKVQLSSKRNDLLDMSAKSGQYQGIIKLLRQIAELQKLPEDLEAQLSSKHFLQAVETLSNATSLANREELLEIPALNDLRQYLKAQAISLVEILVEELHNHLYLKSPYCDGRWAAYVNGQADLPVVALDKKQEPGEKKARKHSTIGRLELEQHQIRQVHEDILPVAGEEKHPEIDSLRYIVILAQSLFSMGKLPYALETMDQRVSVEIAQVVARTKSEVRARHKGTQSNTSVEDTLNTESLESTAEPLRDLLWTLFSKWDAMLQAHRALYDAVASFSDRQFADRRSTQRGGVYEFLVVWQPLENELKSMLSEYLTSTNHQVLRKEDNRAWNPLFSNRSEKPNSLFKISEAQSVKDQSLGGEEHELREMLQTSVPGLLSEKSENISKSEALSRETALQQSKLAPNTPFNITAVLQPTLAFLNRAKRIVPESSAPTPSNLSLFLDQFLEITYYSQLTETVDVLYRKVVEAKHINTGAITVSTGSQKFQQETDGLLSLIDRLGSLLSSIPYRQSVFAQTVLSIVANYYQKCVSWLTHLTANEFPDAHLGALKLGSSWANRQEIRDLWQTYDYDTANEVALYEALTTEMAALFRIKQDYVIRSEDLLQDPSQFQSLVSLYQAVTKFEKDIRKFQLSTDTQHNIQFSGESQAAFGKLLNSWQSLGRSILVVIRMELRAHVLFYLQLILGQGNYNIEEKANEIDSFVVDLNSDLLAICTLLRVTNNNEYRFLMAGLAKLINEVLIEDSSIITVMTLHGAEKLTLGISALQQNLRNLVPDPAEADLSRAAKFYTHFQLGPRGLTEQASTDASFDFTHDQAAKLLTLMYSTDLANEPAQRNNNRDSISIKRRQLNEHLEKLSSQMLTVA